MKALIIEDEQFAADKLIKLIYQYDPAIHILEVLESVEDAVQWFRQNPQPDILFTDIHLGDGSSFEIFEQIQVTCPIIFTTAYDQYAIKAFKTNSIDYLLKPIRYQDLQTALDKLMDLSKWPLTNHMNKDLSALSEVLLQGQIEYKSRFLVRIGNTLKSIPIADVAYFQFEDRITVLITKDNHKYPIQQTLDELIEVLDPKQFIRANRKFVINIEAIKKIHPWFKSRLKLELSPPQKTDLVISTEKTPIFKAWLDR